MTECLHGEYIYQCDELTIRAKLKNSPTGQQEHPEVIDMNWDNKEEANMKWLSVKEWISTIVIPFEKGWDLNHVGWNSELDDWQMVYYDRGKQIFRTPDNKTIKEEITHILLITKP